MVLTVAVVPEVNSGTSSVCVPIYFTADMEQLPHSVAGVERSMYRAGWKEAIKL